MQISTIARKKTEVLDNFDGSRSLLFESKEIVRHWPQERRVKFYAPSFTPGTRMRMAQASEAWGLPFRVSFSLEWRGIEVIDDTKRIAFHPFKNNVVEFNY